VLRQLLTSFGAKLQPRFRMLQNSNNPAFIDGERVIFQATTRPVRRE